MAFTKSKIIKSLDFSKLPQRSRILIFALLFGVVGTVFILISQAATTSQTFNGKLTTRQSTQNFNVTVQSGQMDATLTLKETTLMTLSLSDQAGTVIATKSGSSPVSLTASVSSGSYKLSVSSASQVPKKGIAFTLNTTNTTSPANDTTPPTAPTNLIATPKSSSSIDLAWSASTDNVEVVGYDIYRGGVKVGSTAATTYSDSGLTASTAYSYQVKAKDTAGNLSVFSNSANATTLAPAGDTQAPTAPTGLTATVISNYQINLTWSGATDNVGVTGYTVYVSGNEVATTTATSYEHKNLTPQTAYTYTVKAKDAAGNLSAASNSAVATTTSVTGDTTPPSAPTNFKATVNNPTQITLNWTASTDNVGVVSYKLTRQPHYPVGSVLANLGSSAVSYVDTSVKPNTVYSYYLEVKDAAGNSNSANVYFVFTGGSANVTVTSPAIGDTVSGNITVSGTASSRSGQVTKVEIATSYGNYQPVNGTANWTAQIDTTKILDSNAEIIQKPTSLEPIDRYIFVKVTDSTGDFKVTAVPIKVKNDTTPPTATLISPAQRTLSTETGFQTISGTASDNVGVKQVYLTSLNGSTHGQIIADGTTNWSATFARLNNNFPINRMVVVDVNGNKTEIPIEIWTPGSSFTGTISGRSYQDSNKNGVYDSGDQPLANHWVYLYTKNKGMGQYLGNTKTDAEGKYSFTNLQNGDYRVAYGQSEWRSIWYDWVSSNNSVKGFASHPYQYVSLNGSATADYPWRKVERIPNDVWFSQDHYGLVDSYTGPNGLTTRQYDDFVPAKAIYDRVMAGKLIGAEAAKTTVNEGNQRASSSTIGYTSGSYSSDGTTGRCLEASATSSVYWPYWHGEYEDNDDATLFHEYGHNWHNYWSCLHQDPGFVEYLRVRGVDLTTDLRINSSYEWSAFEIIAEDYRQLFNGATTSEYQKNNYIPRAAEVPGLKDYMINTYRIPR